MALRTPASWIQGGSHSAENDRLTERAGTLSAGIVGSGDLAVSQNGTPNMSVNVAAGAAFVLGSITSTQGYYKVYNDATVNLAITAANGSNPRIDIVVVTINDAQYSGATNNAVLQVIAGTPAASPVAPAAPANSYILAQVLVGTAVVSITNANITDKRTRVIEAPQTFQSDAATAVGLIVRGAVSQSGNLQQWQDSGASVLSYIDSAGDIHCSHGIFGGGAFGGVNAFTLAGSSLGRSFFTSNGASEVPVIAQGFASQTADLQQWQASGGSVLAKVDASGNVFAPNLTAAWTSYTPTFTNCTGPTGTFKYLLMGKTLFIRGYFTGGTATATAQVKVSLPNSLTIDSTFQPLACDPASAGGWFVSLTNITTRSNVTAAASLTTMAFAGAIEIT